MALYSYNRKAFPAPSFNYTPKGQEVIGITGQYYPYTHYRYNTDSFTQDISRVKLLNSRPSARDNLGSILSYSLGSCQSHLAIRLAYPNRLPLYHLGLTQGRVEGVKERLSLRTQNIKHSLCQVWKHLKNQSLTIKPVLTYSGELLLFVTAMCYCVTIVHR